MAFPPSDSPTPGASGGISPAWAPVSQTVGAVSTPTVGGAPAAGGASRTLMTDLRESFYLTFSPDSKTIAALRGPEIGKLKLVLIDVASGSERVVAHTVLTPGDDLFSHARHATGCPCGHASGAGRLMRTPGSSTGAGRTAPASLAGAEVA